MEGWGWQSVHNPEILPSVLERWEASLAMGQAFEMEFPLRGADGVFRWFLTRIRPVRNSEGRIVRWFGTNTDIHEQRELRQSLIEARQELEMRVRERTAELEQKASELLQKATLLDLVNDAIFVRCAEDKISYWNEGAERLYGWKSGEVLGRSPHEVLHTEFPVPLEEIKSIDKWEGELRQIKRDGSQIVVTSRWTTLRDNEGKPAGWLEINTDITARKRAEEAARNLSGRILSLQDEERRRIARGLHDSLGQYLTAIKMSLDLLSTMEGRQAAVASECSEIVDKCLTETRTISHLLHPPLLDEAGLRSALQWYVEGFAQRSDIQVKLDLPAELGRLDTDVETALFRVVQEALTNVHRHSSASEVDIRLFADTKHIQLDVSDNGKGIPKDRLQRVRESGSGTGVGLAGMRERVRDLGGSMEIKSDDAGTTIIICIPLTELASIDSQENGESVRSISAA
jgi:PAS domain S-box-containing protein